MDRSGYAQRLKMQKDAGVNTIRLTTHQSSPEMYDLCNEMGMMIWQEMPLQWAYSASEPIHRDILKIARETMVQTRPHPCVIGYSAWNEGGQPEFTNRVVDLMLGLDSTRPISRACGGGDWDIHIYTDMSSSLTRLTPLWTGHTLRLHQRDRLLRTSHRGGNARDARARFVPLRFGRLLLGEFLQLPARMRSLLPGYAPRVRLAEGESPEIRARKAACHRTPPVSLHEIGVREFPRAAIRPLDGACSTAASTIPCLPPNLGIVSFNGRPRKAYFAAKEAMQTVLPILFFDMTGAEDLRVINDYWHKSWKGCTLKYTLKNRDGSTIKHIERKFDLPEDATVKVLTREEVGDVWRLPGFFAELQIVTADGALLSENHYDMTNDEIVAFVTNVYPVAPAKPVAAIVLKGADAAKLTGTHRQLAAKDAYSEKLLELGGEGKACAAEYKINVPKAGRVFCSRCLRFRPRSAGFRSNDRRRQSAARVGSLPRYDSGNHPPPLFQPQPLLDCRAGKSLSPQAPINCCSSMPESNQHRR